MKNFKNTPTPSFLLKRIFQRTRVSLRSRRKRLIFRYRLAVILLKITLNNWKKHFKHFQEKYLFSVIIFLISFFILHSFWMMFAKLFSQLAEQNGILGLYLADFHEIENHLFNANDQLFIIQKEIAKLQRVLIEYNQTRLIT
jgi:hypothetical protein